MGYRMIDCASGYLNEHKIGDALEELFTGGVVKREDLFITSKLNENYHHPDHVRPHLKKTLFDLKIDYLDLYLIHWPVATTYIPYDPNKRGWDDNYDPWENVKIENIPIQQTWKAMEELQKEGLVKSIGVSNFNVALLHDLLSYATIKPVVNQVEMHPYLQQPQLLEYCKRVGIHVQAYSSLGTSDSKQSHEPSILADPTINNIAAKYQKTAAQVCIQWGIQRGTCVIAKSVTTSHLLENLLSEFQLSDEDMKLMQSLDRNFRFLRPEDWSWKLPLFH